MAAAIATVNGGVSNGLKMRRRQSDSAEAPFIGCDPRPFAFSAPVHRGPLAHVFPVYFGLTGPSVHTSGPLLIESQGIFVPGQLHYPGDWATLILGTDVIYIYTHIYRDVKKKRRGEEHRRHA